MKGLNKVQLIGNLGRDPEVRYTASGSAVANLAVATTDSRKDKQSGDWVDQTEWHRVVLFGRTAEVAQEYLKKGSQVYFEGKLQTRKWTDKDGIERFTTEVVANEMQILGVKASSNGASAHTEGTSTPATPPPQRAAAAGDPWDDDIPFARPAAVDGLVGFDHGAASFHDARRR